MACDSRPGSKTWKRAISLRFGGPHRKPHLSFAKCGDSAGWYCDARVHGAEAEVCGFGATPEEAFVDFIEELWCLSGEFPEGYPN